MKRFIQILSGAAVFVAFTATRAAAQNLANASPLGFFTNVAARVLSTEMGVDLNHIQVYPTNQYTPAVHRLLQVTANIYDATAGNYFPSVFRPLFTVDGAGNVFVTGYTNVSSVAGPGDWQLAPPMDASLLAALPGPVVNLATNVYGVPWIIGVKTGFPTFNAFVQENIVGLTRRLQVTRDVNYETQHPYSVRLTGTNQMLLFSINASAGVDFWNSYLSNFMDNVTVVCHGFTFMTITNDDPGFDGTTSGVLQPMAFQFNTLSTIGPASATYWPGTTPWNSPDPYGTGQPNPNSFFVPLNFTDYTVLTNSVYRTPLAGLTPGAMPNGQIPPCLIPTNYFNNLGMTVVFETNTPGFPLPHFGLLSTNFLQVFILDGANGVTNVIDYVQLEEGNSQSLNAALFTDDESGVWNTNVDVVTVVPYGIENQINISRGLNPFGSGGLSAGEAPGEDGTWQADPEAAYYAGTVNVPQQQANFLAFFLPYGILSHLSDAYGQATGTNYLAQTAAPYAPTRYAVGYTILQANDPLVHYLASDLTLSLPPGFLQLSPNYNNSIFNIPPPASLSIGSLNDNYQPWGGNPSWNDPLFDTNAVNLAERDPLVSQPDDWNFPTNQPLNASWLGQVHRGTPWQTIYLKSTDIQASPNGLSAWMNWTGDQDPADAAAMAPVQDWHLASLLAGMFNTDDLSSLFSVNNPNPNAWQGLMNGLTALTNTASGGIDAILISSNSPQASIIANAIETARAGQPNQFFPDAGDILAVPQLSAASPFLNNATAGTISDAAYEAIPAQLLPLIRSDSIGSMSSANGQVTVQFSGYDDHSYAIEISPDLLNWTILGTNCPKNGVITIAITPCVGGNQFYRSRLVQ